MSSLIDRARVEKETAYREERRLQAQTDILFLLRLLGYNKIVDRVHGPVAQLCVQKNPALSIEQQSSVKESLQLDPRGTYKSTFSIGDSVQWITCFPNIRICKLTATKPLAAAIVGEITDHFVLAPGAEKTDFNLLFPEYLITPREKRVGEYTAPCRTRAWREATVMAFSIETSISGWHFDVLDPDDIVDTLNSSTPQGIEKVKKNYRINKKTLMPWGYINAKGTRYNPFDHWGDVINNAKAANKKDKDAPPRIKLLVRSALTLKNGQRLERGEFPAESEVTLLFPELLSYEFLKNEFDDDYSSFMTQYMNDAYGANEVVFLLELLEKATVPSATIPVSGETFIAWRFAYGDILESGGAVGAMQDGRMYITDARTGVFKPSALAYEVVMLAKAHGVHTVSIEDTPGARYNEPAILNYAATVQWPLQINWLEFQEDDGARNLRLKSIEPLLTSTRMLFSDGIECLAELYRQFGNYGMVDENAIVDAVSRVGEQLPKSIIPTEATDEQTLNWELARQRDIHDKMHGIGQYAATQPIEEEKPYQPEGNSYGLPEIMPGLNG